MIIPCQNSPFCVWVVQRFLSGDDNYRKSRLKIIPAIVDAPYVIRSMAPKNSVLTIQRNGLLDTIYHMHETKGSQRPIVEVTLDLMGTRAIRGMAALVKRYLTTMSVDFAAIISKPDGQVKDEPQACLGLWRFDHIDVTNCPDLPDRFCDEAAVAAASAKNLGGEKRESHPDILRASQLMQLAEQEMSSRHLDVSVVA